MLHLIGAAVEKFPPLFVFWEMAKCKGSPALAYTKVRPVSIFPVTSIRLEDDNLVYLDLFPFDKGNLFPITITLMK